MISDEEYERILREGVRLWNEHKFFECHDKLEEAWKAVKHEKKKEPASDPRRDFLHGLILLAVAYHHWRNGNRVGALRKRDEALAKLRRYPTSFAGIRLGPWRDAATKDFERLDRDPNAPFRADAVPLLPG
ncbi:MAG: DUF309 domain-containing protein [Euryarchaeota archaeon]|nr:DUF309 domain-containing protein [Euryarchaeota archaeon]